MVGSTTTFIYNIKSGPMDLLMNYNFYYWINQLPHLSTILYSCTAIQAHKNTMMNSWLENQTCESGPTWNGASTSNKIWRFDST